MKKYILCILIIIHMMSFLNANSDTVQFVNDYAKILEPFEARVLEDKLQHYAKASGIKVYIGNLKTIGRKSIKEYAHELFEKLPLSAMAKIKTVVVLVSRKEMQGFIYEGKDITPYLPSTLKKKMIRSMIIQSFKKNQHLASYELLILRMQQLFSQKITPTQLQNQLDKEKQTSPGIFFYLQFVMFVLLFVIVLLLFGKSVFKSK